MWPSETPPDGWLELNGQQFDVTENHKLAIMFLSGQLPDYRGRFPRGWANGSLVDPDSNREINSLQDDALQEIQGEFVIDDWGWVDGKLFRIVGGRSGGWDSQDGGLAVEFKAGNVARTSTETRPCNVATMFIIKTDKADSKPGVPVPPAVIVTPRPATVNAGTFVQFSGQVLPSNFGVEYPVSWSVSDASLGSIDATGRYTAIAGRTGSQSVIASISTGLTTLVTFDQHIYLTNIAIEAIPNIQVDGTY
ncbi:tail fiber protein [Candidatus Symbiopectobacterium endolongispinus]|nr:tail fiber protein [Candidatus Symbiopectobacterium endolongispinus]